MRGDRVSVGREGHKGTFWRDGNVLYLDRGMD